MSRLLFAAARGARIQELSGIPDCYEDTTLVFLDDDNTETLYQRIHPDDEHLQYGPISSALREFAELGHNELIPMGFPAFKVDFYEIDRRVYSRCDDELHRSLFLLILAEALADEGL